MCSFKSRSESSSLHHGHCCNRPLRVLRAACVSGRFTTRQTWFSPAYIVVPHSHTSERRFGMEVVRFAVTAASLLWQFWASGAVRPVQYWECLTMGPLLMMLFCRAKPVQLMGDSQGTELVSHPVWSAFESRCCRNSRTTRVSRASGWSRGPRAQPSC